MYDHSLSLKAWEIAWCSRFKSDTLKTMVSQHAQCPCCLKYKQLEDSHAGGRGNAQPT
jgi:hypothetical protein